jgi:DNA-binding PadR family transcriptional regulator
LAEAREEALRKPQEIYRESLRNLILRLLAEKPRHGYDIIKRIEEITGGRWKPAAGTLYPLLEQMSDEGLIEVDRVESEGVKGGKRVVYRLTERGWRELVSLLLSKLSYKLDFISYYFVESCTILRERGFEAEAEALCSELRKGLEKLMKSVESHCTPKS